MALVGLLIILVSFTSLPAAHRHLTATKRHIENIYIYIYIYVCVCVGGAWYGLTQVHNWGLSTKRRVVFSISHFLVAPWAPREWSPTPGSMFGWHPKHLGSGLPPQISHKMLIFHIQMYEKFIFWGCFAPGGNTRHLTKYLTFMHKNI